MSKKLIAGNWKMNPALLDAHNLADALKKNADSYHCDVLICPPFVYLERMVALFQSTKVLVGAQDCSPFDNGAYTGDISASMIRDMGGTHVILGHSERRQYHTEHDALIAQKAAKAHEKGLVTIICVGETETQRQSGQEKHVVEMQLLNALPDSALPDNTIIAYEPVWAIGTGKTATPDDVSVMHVFVNTVLQDRRAGVWRILYGGSMKPDSAAALLACPHVDGGLIGGASLQAEQFEAIIRLAGSAP